MQYLEESAKAVLHSPLITPGARWAKPENGPITIGYTIITGRTPEWIFTHLAKNPVNREKMSWNIVSEVTKNPELPFWDFTLPAHALPKEFTPYLNAALRSWEKIANIQFVPDNKNPALFFHFSEGSYVGPLCLWSASTLRDIQNGTIVRAAVNIHLDSIKTSLDLKNMGHVQHPFSHELGHVLGLHHPNITKPSFRVDHYTIMEYAKDHSQLVSFPAGADQRALEILYGPHPVSTVNNTYYFNETAFPASEIRWHIDNSGTDTLIANCNNSKYDLRDGTLEGCGRVAYTTPNAIENVVATGKNILIRLNLHANHVDIRDSNATQVFTDAPESGNNSDFIDGFKCGDRIIVAHPGVETLNITHLPNRMEISAGNYTVTVTGNFNPNNTHTVQQGTTTGVLNTEDNCLYVEGRSLPSTFVVAFLKSSVIQGIRGLLNSFGCSEIQVEAFDRVLMASAAYYETRNLYAASLLTIIGPALRIAGLSKKQAGIIETALCVGVGLYQDPAKMLTSFAGSFFAFGTWQAMKALRDSVFGETATPRLKTN